MIKVVGPLCFGQPDLIRAVLLWDQSPYQQTTGRLCNVLVGVGGGKVLIARPSTENKRRVVTLKLAEEGGGVYVTLGKVGEWGRGEGGCAL